MVSFQAFLSEDMIGRRKTIPGFENSPKKRKLEDEDVETNFEKRPKADQSKRSLFDMELHLETPLPFEWQRCLDIQSGQIHFYNTKTDMKTSKEPTKSPEFRPPISPAAPMSLDLELNLTCDSVRKTDATSTGYHHHDDHQFNKKHSSISPTSTTAKKGSSVDHTKIKSSRQSLSWLGVEENDDEEEQEMIATVCMRCHMLVMLCRSSPTCPNCKFMHPPDQGPLKLFKQRLSLLL